MTSHSQCFLQHSYYDCSLKTNQSHYTRMKIIILALLLAVSTAQAKPGGVSVSVSRPSVSTVRATTVPKPAPVVSKVVASHYQTNPCRQTHPALFSQASLCTKSCHVQTELFALLLQPIPVPLLPSTTILHTVLPRIWSDPYDLVGCPIAPALTNCVQSKPSNGQHKRSRATL